MKSIIATTALVAAGLTAGTANAQCKETDGYVFITAQCQQQAKDVEEPGPCEQAPDEEKTMLYFISNVLADEAETRSSLGSMFYYYVGQQHGAGLQGNTSQCFETEEAAEEGRTKAIERFHEFFHEYDIVVKDVEIERPQ